MKKIPLSKMLISGLIITPLLFQSFSALAQSPEIIKAQSEVTESVKKIDEVIIEDEKTQVETGIKSLQAIINLTTLEAENLSKNLEEITNLTGEFDSYREEFIANLKEDATHLKNEVKNVTLITDTEGLKKFVSDFTTWKSEHDKNTEQIVNFLLVIKSSDALDVGYNRLRKIKAFIKNQPNGPWQNLLTQSTLTLNKARDLQLEAQNLFLKEKAEIILAKEKMEKASTTPETPTLNIETAPEKTTSETIPPFVEVVAPEKTKEVEIKPSVSETIEKSLTELQKAYKTFVEIALLFKK